MVGSNIAHFDALLEAAAAAYPVDRDRVYVVGHSMGAGVAAMIAQVRADRLAGVVCIAGGPRGRLEAQPAPMLVFAGEFDPLFPARRMREQATQAAKDGRRVEFREAKGNGHTLIVGAKLAEAVEWMLARKLEPPPAPPAPKDEMMAPPEGSPKG
jgi:pimeloyl-ACP methyl ester carboxylesterase